MGNSSLAGGQQASSFFEFDFPGAQQQQAPATVR
jgi:hypothetical protein